MFDTHGEDARQDATFDAFLSLYRSRVIAHLCRCGATREDAQDIVQESMVRLMRYKAQPEDALRALFYRIALNLLRDGMRTSRRAPPMAALDSCIDSEWAISGEPSPFEMATVEQEVAQVGRAVDALPPRCREIYLLTRIEGLTYPEVAARCGVSVKAVEKQVTKALTALRLAMDKQTREARG